MLIDNMQTLIKTIRFGVTNEESNIYMCKPQISEGPPEAVHDLLWNICGRHSTRLKGFKEHSKINERCIWCLYKTSII
jgi:hypothetical protein